MRRVRRIFITGVLVLIPITVTLSIIGWVVLKIDSIFGTPIRAVTGHNYIGLGLTLTIILIFIIGILATNYFGKKIIKNFEKAISRIPIVNIIYSSIKQLQDNIVLKKNQKAFKNAVMLEYPSKGIFTIGFVTARAPIEIEEAIGTKVTSVFIPTTPNPTSGMFIMIPDKNLKYLDMPVDIAIKLIVSGGILSPDYSGQLNKNEKIKIDKE